MRSSRPVSAPLLCVAMSTSGDTLIRAVTFSDTSHGGVTLDQTASLLPTVAPKQRKSLERNPPGNPAIGKLGLFASVGQEHISLLSASPLPTQTARLRSRRNG